jgi:hypothetical protein
MDKKTNDKKALPDGLYYVSAADLADKIIHRLRPTLDSLTVRNSRLAATWLARWSVPTKQDALMEKTLYVKKPD